MIKKGTMNEIELYMAIIKRAIQELDDRGILQWDEIYPDQQTMITDIKDEELYLYEKAGIIKGIITLNEQQDVEYNDVNWCFNSEKILVVHRICIDPHYQGQGVGKKLMQYAEDYARQNGYGAIRLDAFTQNSASCGLYEKLGYKKVGIITLRKGPFYCYEKSII